MEKETLRNRLNEIYTNHERIIKDQEKLLNTVDRLIADIVSEDAPKKGKKRQKKVSEEIRKPLTEMGELNQELTVKQILAQHPEQPQNDSHIQSVINCVRMHNATAEQLEDALDRIKQQNDKGKVNDIRTYTYKTLHKINTAA